MRRRALRPPSSRFPQISITGAPDPRGFGRAYSPRFQNDQLAMEHVRREGESGLVDWEQVLGSLYNQNFPPQLVQASYLAQVTAVGVPVLLIPKNPRRASFKICNFWPAIGAATTVAGLTFSYDQPVAILSSGGATVVPGQPVLAKDSYEETNGTVSIQDIWVWSNTTTDPFPFYVLGYEGTLSIAKVGQNE